ncbi:MAG: hypothetical protein ACREL6_12545 [Gemmatimonadales bacterium]
MRPSLSAATVLLIAASGCGGEAKPSCGIVALAGHTLLLNEFSVPNRTLSSAPAGLPDRLVARVAAGPALPAVVGRTDSGWVIGVEGTLPAQVEPTFGVLVVNESGAASGMMLYEGGVIQDAPMIGSVAVKEKMLPLIGIQVNPERFEDPNCRLFPDSALQ